MASCPPNNSFSDSDFHPLASRRMPGTGLYMLIALKGLYGTTQGGGRLSIASTWEQDGWVLERRRTLNLKKNNQPTASDSMLLRVSPLWLARPKHVCLSSLWCFGLWTLEMPLRGNVIIRKAPKAIQADECRPRRRSSSRFCMQI